jgi:hypothetical protein
MTSLETGHRLLSPVALVVELPKELF